MSSTAKHVTRKLRSADHDSHEVVDSLPQDDGILGKSKSNLEATVSNSLIILPANGQAKSQFDGLAASVNETRQPLDS